MHRIFLILLCSILCLAFFAQPVIAQQEEKQEQKVAPKKKEQPQPSLRECKLQIDYDKDPPKGWPEPIVVLVDKKSGVVRMLASGKKIMSGKYLLEIKCLGYSYGNPKAITIKPDEKPYVIHEKIFMIPEEVEAAVKGTHRFVKYSITYKDKSVSPEEILLDEKPFPYEMLVPVGEYTVTVKKTGFATIVQKVKIESGVEPYVFYAKIQLQ